MSEDEDLIAILLLSVLTALATGTGLSAARFALTLGRLTPTQSLEAGRERD